MRMNKSRPKSDGGQGSHSVAGCGLRRPLVTVLHIDDDANDTELFRAAVRKANVEFSVQHVNDGEQAMAYLSARGIYANRAAYPLPSLVLLDLKMPRATGFDVLRWIRNHPEVGNLPIVIFSGSELQDDIQQAYAGGADSYLVKPIGFNSLIDLVKRINASWVSGQTQRGAEFPLGLAASGWQLGSLTGESGATDAHP